MNKGISFYFGYDIKPKERVKLLKEAGFDSVITTDDKRWRFQNGSLRQQIKLLKQQGLKWTSLHMGYLKKELPALWQKGKLGEKLKKNLIKDVRKAKKYNFTCVVVHLAGEYSQVGENRLLEVLEVCEKLNIPLAIENLSNFALFKQVFENIKHPMLKFCLDIGHNNAYTPDVDFFKTYGDKLITLHLHNNDGSCDQHTLYGNVDWKKLGKNLKNHKEISLDFELIPKNPLPLTAEEFLKKAKDLADQLETFIFN